MLIKSCKNLKKNLQILNKYLRKGHLKLVEKTNRQHVTSNMLSFLLYTNSSNNWTKQLNEFYHIWPLGQWISSVLGLILLYWVTGYYYNKWLSEKGGWLDSKTRIWLIVSDLLINLTLGLYYMNHRETIFGVIMLRCPIAISPFIFVLELICVYSYYRFGKNTTWFTKKTK